MTMGNDADLSGKHAAGNGADSSANNAATSGGPKAGLSDSLAKPLPKRFYNTVGVGDGAFFQVLLDGRVIKTPAKRALVLPTRALAELVAGEWDAQATHVDPASMPLTRFANTAIDAVSQALEDVAADIVAYSGRDLLCYRAQHEQPDLVRRQTQCWDPIIAWAQSALGARFEVTQGLMPIDQPRATLNAIAAALQPHEPFRLTALHVITTLTGSAILALAMAQGAFSEADAWSAAHLDEDYQIALWGEDWEAGEKRKQRRGEFAAASCMLDALQRR